VYWDVEFRRISVDTCFLNSSVPFISTIFVVNSGDLKWKPKSHAFPCNYGMSWSYTCALPGYI
jgi:hypothetical protein